MKLRKPEHYSRDSSRYDNGFIIAASEDEVVDTAWHCDHTFRSLSKADRVNFTSGLLLRAESADKRLRARILSSLRNLLPDMLDDQQVFYIKNFLRMMHDQDSEERLELWDEISRLSRLVCKAAQTLISMEFISFKGAYEQRGELDDAVLRVYSETNNDELLVGKMPLFSQRARHYADRLTENMQQESAGSNVALIIPEFLSGRSFLQPPLDMLYVVSALRGFNIQPEFIDNRVAKFSLDVLCRRLATTQILCVTTTPYDQVQNYFVDYRYKYACETIRRLKEANPKSTILVCGSHGTVRPDIVLRDTNADFVIRGAYDKILHQSILQLIDGKTPSGPNVVSKYKVDASLYGDSVSVSPDLSNLGAVMPAYDLIDMEDYFGDVYQNNEPRRLTRWAAILGSRGCAYNCNFCYNFWGRQTILRDVVDVVDEIEILQRKYQAEHFFFSDFTLTQNRSWVEQLCVELKKRTLNAKWMGQTRCDLVEPSLMREMASAGCERLWLGIESFSGEIVRSASKYSTAAFALKAIQECTQAGIAPHAFIMVGLPGESVDTLNNLFGSLHRWKVPYTRSIMVATPRFGTALYLQAKAQYPELGDSFTGLYSVRGLVGNNLKPRHIHDAIEIMRNREFIFAPEPPKILR